ncbi:MAG TPA: hypothetical protein VMJ10_25065 [Kofleriaceae bacterium]|nr:hypothetical protein [Kofleriaceae bacterium]
MRVWARAVVAPAARRAGAVWEGCAIVAAVIFGRTAMHPRDLTGLAVGSPGVGAVLAATWVLLMLPSARFLVRGDAATYLRALPGPTWTPRLAAAAALVALQLPWLVLWLAGAGARGLAVIAATTIVLVALARIRPRRPRPRRAAWKTATRALAGVYARALGRRASDALVRGAGLAVLAGLTAGLFVRNNALPPRESAAIGAAVVAVVLAPGVAGLVMALLDAHRASAWLAATLGISETARRAVLAAVVASIYAIGAAIASAAAALVVEPAALVYLAPAAISAAAGSSLFATRALVRVEHADPRTTALRVVIGVIAVPAASIVALGLLGPSGVLALAAAGALAFATAKGPA